MLVDVICVALVLLLGYLGWRRGFVRSLVPLLGMAAAYLAAWLLYRPLGQILGGVFSLQPLLSYPLGGAVAFVLTLVAFSLLGLAVRRRRVVKRRGRGIMLLDRSAGALLGAAYGTALVLVIAWALLTFQTVAGPRGPAPDMRASRLGRAAVPVAEAVARRVAGGQTGSAAVGETAARFARDPVRTTRDLSEVLVDGRVRAVLEDREALRAMAKDPKRAARDPRVRALAQDPKMIERLQRVGLVQVPESGELAPQEARRQLAQRLRPAARVATQLARDPEVRVLLEDRELRRLLERRDLLALANDPKFNRLAEIVVSRLQQINSEGAP